MVGYQEYITSSEWHKKKKEASETKTEFCYNCGRLDREIKYHHNTYQNLGHEKKGQVERLCGPCHADHHGYTYDRDLMIENRMQIEFDRVRKRNEEYK